MYMGICSEEIKQKLNEDFDKMVAFVEQVESMTDPKNKDYQVEAYFVGQMFFHGTIYS